MLASCSGAVGKAQFVESALQELFVSLCCGNHRIVAAYSALNVRMTGVWGMSGGCPAGCFLYAGLWATLF